MLDQHDNPLTTGDDNDSSKWTGSYVSLGILIGMTLGMLLGMLFDEIPFMLAVGLIAGIGIGAAIGYVTKRNSSRAVDSAQDNSNAADA